jgi:ankyrin repeat protein
VKSLLFHQASPQLGDFNSTSPLHVAACIGDNDNASLLLDSGADIDARDRLGYTPLVYACSKGRIDAIDFLLT